MSGVSVALKYLSIVAFSCAGSGKLVGLINSDRLMISERQNIILVDHNEESGLCPVKAGNAANA